MFNCREVMLVNIFRLTPTKSEVSSQMVWKVKRRIDCSDLAQIIIIVSSPWPLWWGGRVAPTGGGFPALLWQRSDPQQVQNRPDPIIENCQKICHDDVVTITDGQGRHVGKNGHPDHWRHEQVGSSSSSSPSWLPSKFPPWQNSTILSVSTFLILPILS